MRLAFGGKNIKFRSICPQNLGELKELDGNFYKRNNCANEENPGSWKSFLNKTSANDHKPIKGRRYSFI